jgi:Protein of unknown function (DUF2635)
MRIKPAPGRLVRDPYTRAEVPPEGRNVSETSYWLRRVRDGDVIRMDGEQPAPEPVEPVEEDLDGDDDGAEAPPESKPKKRSRSTK